MIATHGLVLIESFHARLLITVSQNAIIVAMKAAR